MAYYYKYNFISPEPLFSIIKEEMKAYMDTGAIDDLMFPLYTDKCLKKLGRSSYIIREEVLHIEDFEARLPDNFYAVREAWLCTSIHGVDVPSANSFYSQTASSTTIQVSPLIVGGEVCGMCNNLECNCLPEVIQSVYKTNNSFRHSYKKEYLLKPGNISVKKQCTLDCANFSSSSADSFDIRDNKFVTNFRNGKVYLIFYATEYDETGNQMIPDNYRIKEYIEAFIRYKMYETLFNQVNDETYKQLESKVAYYEKKANEAYILADIEIKKSTIYQQQRSIKNDLNRFRMYELPNKTNRYWRRNP
jgi:hypothetical protein